MFINVISNGHQSTTWECIITTMAVCNVAQKGNGGVRVVA